MCLVLHYSLQNLGVMKNCCKFSQVSSDGWDFTSSAYSIDNFSSFFFRFLSVALFNVLLNITNFPGNLQNLHFSINYKKVLTVIDCLHSIMHSDRHQLLEFSASIDSVISSIASTTVKLFHKSMLLQSGLTSSAVQILRKARCMYLTFTNFISWLNGCRNDITFGGRNSTLT